MSRRIALAPLASALLFAAPARAADPWHLAGWEARAVVEVTAPAKEPGVDTAGVKVLCQGRGKPDGSDYRVVDAAGRPVPFLLASHDPARYSLLSFRAADPKGRYFVYFGNPRANRAPEQVVDDPAPGAGPPKGAWVPRHGLVLQTIERPESPLGSVRCSRVKLTMLADKPGEFGSFCQANPRTESDRAVRTRAGPPNSS